MGWYGEPVVEVGGHRSNVGRCAAGLPSGRAQRETARAAVLNQWPVRPGSGPVAASGSQTGHGDGSDRHAADGTQVSGGDGRVDRSVVVRRECGQVSGGDGRVDRSVVVTGEWTGQWW